MKDFDDYKVCKARGCLTLVESGSDYCQLCKPCKNCGLDFYCHVMIKDIYDEAHYVCPTGIYT